MSGYESHGRGRGWSPRAQEPVSHNHPGLETRAPGECRECDLTYIPTNLRARKSDGTTIPVTATFGGVADKGVEWVVIVPDEDVVGFEADTGLQEGHVLSFVSPRYVRDKERQEALKSNGPESGPPDDEEQDEQPE